MTSATIKGEREFAFVDSAGKTLTVGADGIAAVTGKPGDRSLYIEVNGLFALSDTGDGKVVVQESGEGDAMSSFTVQDKGKATLPHLGD